MYWPEQLRIPLPRAAKVKIFQLWTALPSIVAVDGFLCSLFKFYGPSLVQHNDFWLPDSIIYSINFEVGP